MDGLARFFKPKQKKYFVKASVIKTREGRTVQEKIEVRAMGEDEAREEVKEMLMEKHHTGLVFIKSVLEKSW